MHSKNVTLISEENIMEPVVPFNVKAEPINPDCFFETDDYKRCVEAINRFYKREKIRSKEESIYTIQMNTLDMIKSESFFDFKRATEDLFAVMILKQEYILRDRYHWTAVAIIKDDYFITQVGKISQLWPINACTIL